MREEMMENVGLAPSLRCFDYKGSGVRTVVIDGDPWFVLKDVCGVLDLTSPHKVAERLDADERREVPVIDAMGRSQDTTAVSEPGLYGVIMRSNKPEAREFKP